MVFKSVIGKEIRDYCTKIIRLRSWLHMLVIRRRYRKVKAAVPKIGGLFRRALARKKVKALRLDKLEQQRVRSLETFIAKSKDKAQLNKAAEKI